MNTAPLDFRRFSRVCRLLGCSIFLCLQIGGSAWAASPEADRAPRPHAEKPNIVFIISDDHAWTDYGFMGHPEIETPNLDQLASRSARFSRGYVPTALCRPALMTLVTGLYSHQHKTSGNDPALLPEENGEPRKGQRKRKSESPEYAALREQLIAHVDEHPTLPKLLSKQGYLSHQSGKWWEGNFKRGGFTHGMTRGFPEPGGRHGDDGLKIGRQGMEPVLDFVDMAVAKEKPFFLWYAPFMPHTPHTPPERLFKKYKAKGIESDFVARYYAMVEWFDESCGKLLDHLDSRGLTENTLIVYVADNGWIQKPDAPGYAPRSKQSANEGGTRQPTLFSWPGVIQPGDRGTQLCSSIDIVPTALAAAGAPIPESLPGYNLLPILKSGEPTPREVVYGESFAHDIADIDNPEESLLYRWVIEGKWKLLLTYDGKLGRYASSHPRAERRPQLFDLISDPHENHNVASEHPEVVARLAEKLQQWWPVTERKVLTQWTESLPNVVVFLVDDMGVMDTSVPFLTDAAGEPKRYPLNDFYRTPNLERLAAQGIRFNNFCAMSVCSPTRISIMTGQNAARHRTTNWINPNKNNGGPNGPPEWDWTGLKPEDVTLPKILSARGYRTIHVGKGHFGPEGYPGADPKNIGFDVNVAGSAIGAPGSYYGTRNYARGPKRNLAAVPHLEKYHGTETFLTEALTIEANRHISEAVESKKPFFLYFAHYAVHAPFDADPRFASNYKDSGKPAPAQAFATLIEGMDQSLGDVLDHLHELGVAENTLILFLGDNGTDAPLGHEHAVACAAPLRGKKGSHYEGGMRVPFIAAWAEPAASNPHQSQVPIAAGDIQPQQAAVQDLFPTILAVTDSQPPAKHVVDGLPLDTLLTGSPDPHRHESFLMHYPHAPHRSDYFTSYRDGDWKVIYHYFPSDVSQGSHYQLFHLAADPFESRNVAESKPKQLRRMMQDLASALESHNAVYPVGDDGSPLIPQLP